MNNKPLISICILAYNHEKYVTSCINAILNQTYQNFEIIIVDDGSSDETVKIATQVTQNITQKSIIHTQKNTGNVPMNFNILLSKASGELCYLTSMDDVIKKDSLEKMVNILIQDANIQFCAGDRTEVIDENGKKTGEVSNSPFYNKNHNNVTVHDLFKSEIEISGSFYVQSCLIRKSILDDVGGWEENMLGDDIVIRTKMYKYMLTHPNMTFRIINEAIFDYRHHENNLHKNVERQVETIYQVQEKYGDGLKSQHIYPWSMHGVRQYMQKIDHFVLHNGNKEYKDTMIESIIMHYSNLYNIKPTPNIRPIKFTDVKRYFKRKIKKMFGIKS